MKHLSEEQIVLHYYGDAEAHLEVRRHLSDCPDCQAKFERVQAVLTKIEPAEVPEPPEFFEEKTWLNLRDRLARQPGSLRGWLVAPTKWRVPAVPRFWARWGRKWALAASLVVLLAVAFLAGRYGRIGNVASPSNVAAVNPERVVLVAVGDHLERSQILLVEIMNSYTKGSVDLTTEQRQARDLLDANHLYRVSAQQAGDPAVARLLDDLRRVLTEIANAPSELTAADLQAIPGRIQSQGFPFKIPLSGSQVVSTVLPPS